MKKPHLALQYEMPHDVDILEAYMHKNGGYNKTGLRRIKRSLRKLSAYN